MWKSFDPNPSDLRKAWSEGEITGMKKTVREGFEASVKCSKSVTVISTGSLGSDRSSSFVRTVM